MALATVTLPLGGSDALAAGEGLVRSDSGAQSPRPLLTKTRRIPAGHCNWNKAPTSAMNRHFSFVIGTQPVVDRLVSFGRLYGRGRFQTEIHDNRLFDFPFC